MKQIFRISGAAILMVAGGFALAPVPTPALAGTLTCSPSTVSVSPSGGNLLVTCTDAGGGSTSTCSVTVSPASPPLTSAGGLVNVSASNCGTISGWMVSPATSNSGTTATSFTDSLPATSTTTGAQTYTYTVTGTGSPTTAQASIVVPAPASTGGGGGGTTSCGTPATVAWGSYNRATVTIAGGATGTVQFTPGVLGNPQPKIVIGNGGGGKGLLPIVALASSPCALPTTPDPVIGGGVASVTGLIYFSLTGTPSKWMPVLTSGKTYYVNLQNPSSTAQQFYVDLYD